MLADPQDYHKSGMYGAMILAVTGRPCDEYNLDGKVGIWAFTVVRKAKRKHSNQKTGMVVGKPTFRKV